MKNLSIGIVGLPNVGKSTLFNLLTTQKVLAANYPFATIDPNVGVVAVPNERLETLAALSNSKKKVPAVVEFYDIAGLVKGASQGEGLGNQFLSHIRETQALVIVLRVFASNEVIHISETVDPLRDLEIILTELALKDVETVEKRLKKLESDARTAPRAGGGKAQKDLEVLRRVETALKTSRLTYEWQNEDVVRELQLLTSKRQLYLLNGTSKEVSPALLQKVRSLGGEYIIADLGGNETVLDELIAKSYQLLNLISFFTTGEDETRAWTIARGTKAPQAAGVIHTDFEKKFIRLEVMPYEKLLAAGGWNKAREKGWLWLEGKEYEVQEGDVIVVRHG